MAKTKTVRRSGCIEDRFSFWDKEYVGVRTDPESNYPPKVANDLFEITNPYERALVGLVHSMLFK